MVVARTRQCSTTAESEQQRKAQSQGFQNRPRPETRENTRYSFVDGPDECYYRHDGSSLIKQICKTPGLFCGSLGHARVSHHCKNYAKEIGCPLPAASFIRLGLSSGATFPMICGRSVWTRAGNFSSDRANTRLWESLRRKSITSAPTRLFPPLMKN